MTLRAAVTAVLQKHPGHADQKVHDPHHPHSATADWLRTDKYTHVKQLGGSTNPVHLVKFASGRDGVVKFVSDADEAANEIDTARLARVLGARTPEVAVIDRGHEKYEIRQTLVRGRIAELCQAEEIDDVFYNDPDTAMSAAATDFVTRQPDRHELNWMIDKDGIQLIDNGGTNDPGAMRSDFIDWDDFLSTRDEPTESDRGQFIVKSLFQQRGEYQSQISQYVNGYAKADAEIGSDTFTASPALLQALGGVYKDESFPRAWRMRAKMLQVWLNQTAPEPLIPGQAPREGYSDADYDRIWRAYQAIYE